MDREHQQNKPNKGHSENVAAQCLRHHAGARPGGQGLSRGEEIEMGGCNCKTVD